MAGYTIDNGQQQVTIYPYQDLTSVEGNQILYGFMLPGVYDASLSIADGSTVPDLTSDQVAITIKAGAVCAFERSYLDPDSNITKLFVAKVVLQDDALIPVLKTTLWNSGTNFFTSKKLIIYADWQFDMLNPEGHFAQFAVGAEADIPTIVADNKLILGSFLNHQYFVAEAGTYPPGTTAFPGLDVAEYHVHYELQNNRRLLRRLQAQSDIHNILFTGDGTGVTIGPFRALSGSTVLDLASSTTIATPLRATVPDGHLASEYYQIDVLRVKQATGTVLEWESTLQTKPSPEWDFSIVSQDELVEYISSASLQLQDSGYIVLIAVRSAIDVPVADASLSKIWPKNCYIPDYYVPRIADVSDKSSWLLPVKED